VSGSQKLTLAEWLMEKLMNARNTMTRSDSVTAVVKREYVELSPDNIVQL